MSRLTKSDVETLLEAYDRDPVAALTVSLAKVLGLPGADWAALLAAGPISGGRRELLLSGDTDALDELLRELNELRTL
jgi:hypothetical protein